MKSSPKLCQEGPKRLPRGFQTEMCRTSVKKELQENPASSCFPFLGPFWSPSWGPYCGHVGDFEPKLVPFCLLAWKSLLHGFSDGFWGASEPSRLCFHFSENAILTFSSRSLLASLSTSKTSPKSIQKTLPTGLKKLLSRCAKRCAKQVLDKKCARNPG